MGRGGIYFRQTLPSFSKTQPQDINSIPPQESSGIQLQEIESGSVGKMVDSSSAALLAEIRSKAKKVRIWPFVLIVCILCLAALGKAELPSWAFGICLFLCVLTVLVAIRGDKIRKTVVLFYVLEPHIEKAFQTLHEAFCELKKSSRIWHIESRGDLTTDYGRKVNAGASGVVRRTVINPYAGSPSYFECNVAIPVLPAGRQSLYLLPDRILVCDSDQVGAISYDQIVVSYRPQNFVESDGAPNDAQVIDKTWRYVNKNGGPDRRFNNNRELPVMLYEAMQLNSASGLNELFYVSRTGIASVMESVFKLMAAAIAQREEVRANAGYLKCPCQTCGVFIEFPSEGVGQVINCPKCGNPTCLFQG